MSTGNEDTVAVECIRVRGAVQGVGFRPMVWRLATEHGLRGWVSNDAQGVVMLVGGSAAAIEAFVAALPGRTPPLARIDAIERETVAEKPDNADFRIIASRGGKVRTGVVADAATCPACLAEIADPTARRYRYPFTNCTHCGPRLSIIEAIPYDRGATTMKEFPLCAECAAEYANPEDRRFHAQPIACPVCGPRVWLENADEQMVAATHLSPFKGEAGKVMGETQSNPQAIDAIDSACTLLERGHIVAIKGLGGFQLACDAGNESAVARLRQRKQRERKPLALMARDLDIVRRYCTLSDTEAALLHSPAAPIVILETSNLNQVAAEVAPGVTTLGFMLPNTPLHDLLLKRMARPIVLTSGNLSDEPQCIDNLDSRARLGGIADYFLMHDRGIARRVDDSVVRVMAGKPRLLRRARGYAPAPFRLPEGFAAAPPVLAMGGELKNTFCLLRDGEAVVSHHMGDLADARCHADYVQSVTAYQQLFEHDARIVAVDKHPEYLSRKLGMAMAEQRGLVCAEIQHHHAHIAACMAENGIGLDARPILGVALDGLGYGDDGSLWGGEFLLADYRQCQRIVSLKPVAMPGGAHAIYEPWRNTYAQLMNGLSWNQLVERYGELDLCHFLAGKPRSLLDGMMSQRQQPAGQFLRPTVRRRCRGGRCLPRAGRVRGAGRGRVRGSVGHPHLDRRGRRAVLPVRDFASRQRRFAVHRSAADVVGAPRRSEPRHAGAGHCRTLPQGTGDRHYGPAEDAEPSNASRPVNRHRRLVRWSIPEPHPARTGRDAPGTMRIHRTQAPPGAGQRRRVGTWTGSHCRGESTRPVIESVNL